MSYKRIANLVGLSKQGDKQALGELLECYEEMIKGYGRRYFFVGYESEDLEQIARMKIIEVIDKYDITTGANFTGFIDKVLKNTFNGMLNKTDNVEHKASLNKVNEEGIELWEMLQDDFNLENYIIGNEKIEKLNYILSKLSEEERKILFVSCSSYGGLKEYAKESGLSYATCRYRRDRVLDKVRWWQGL